MSDRYPWDNTSSEIGSELPAQFATPLEAQQAADKAREAAEKVADDALQAHRKTGGNEHPTATELISGFMSGSDKTKLNNVQSGAQKNKNGYSTVNGMVASTDEDGFTINGLTGITVTKNELTKAINITATGESTPGKHGETHLPDGSDPIPYAGSTNGGLMSAESFNEITSLSTDVSNVESSVSEIDAKIGYTFVSVLDYGAKGDGVTDDYQSFIDAIAAAGDKEKVYVPKPTSFYRISQKITIDKPLLIEGNHYEVSAGATTSIVFDNSVTVGFEVTSRDVKIKGLSMKMLNTTNTLVAGINLTNSTPGALSNQMLEDIFIFINGSFGAGVRGKNVITSVVDNVRCYQGAYGFYFDTAGTSIKFDTSWGMSNTKGGFYLSSYEYCDFINCACDSPNNPDYGYHLVNSNGISLISCGAEGIGKSFAKVDNCVGVSFVGCRGVGLNHANSGIASFSEQVNSSDVTYISCMESGQTGFLPNVSATGSLYPVIMNCNFKKVTMDTNTYTNAQFDRGVVRFGGMAINISPFGGPISTVSNHDLFFNEQRIGVVRKDGGAFYGYFDADGGVVTRNIGTLPAASATNRGKILRVEGGTGVADRIYICRKNAADAFEWAPLD